MAAGPLLYFGSVLAAGFSRHPAILWTSAIGIALVVAYAIYDRLYPRSFIDVQSHHRRRRLDHRPGHRG
jgi:hypothetical protein